MSYNDAKSQVQVTVIECKDLKKMDTFGKSDPFVKVYLMPGSHPEMKTKTIKKTLDPQFKEQFQFTVIIYHDIDCFERFSPVQISHEEVLRKTIVLQVFDWDKITKADGIGEVQIPLWQINLQGNGTDEWKQLHKLTGTKDRVS